MDLFTRYNTKDMQDRQIDTLIGLSKGLLADGVLVQSEAEFLRNWLIQNSQTQNPIIMNLLERVEAMLSDGVLDEEETQELFSILSVINGDESELGELAKPSTLPLDQPYPDIIFEEQNFLCTGTFAYGTRKDCQAAIVATGGVPAKGVTKKLNYLILGTYVSDSWIHESFGRKIEKALSYKEEGCPIKIITEEYWLETAGL